MSAAPELTLLTLTWNEGVVLDDFLAKAKSHIVLAGAVELLLIDAGSTDGTVEIAQRHGARVVRQSAPGYGQAYREGLELARGKWIITMDPDGSHPPEFFPELWNRREGADLVMGSRYLAEKGDLRQGLRKAMSWFLNQVFAKLLGVPLTDFSGGYRLYRASAVHSIESQAPHYDVVADVVLKLHGHGFKVVEIPYHYQVRKAGASKARLLSYSWSYVKTLARLWWWLRFSRDK